MRAKLGIVLSVAGAALMFLLIFIPWGLTAMSIGFLGTVFLSAGTLLFGVAGKSRPV